MSAAPKIPASELAPYTPVDDALILAAAERAALHEPDEAVFTSVLTNHLGFEAVPETNKQLWPRLEELRRAGLLTTVDHRGEPLWGLTTVGRERLAAEREADRVGELPEAPQHRAWRHAREEAAVRIEGFREELIDAVPGGRPPDQPVPAGDVGGVVRAERAPALGLVVPGLGHLLPDRVVRARRCDARPRREPRAASRSPGDLSLEPKRREQGETMTRSNAKRGKRAKAKPKDGRLGPGQLDGLVLAYMRKRKDDGPLTAGAVAKGMDRSSGAVANCLVRLAKAKKIRLARRKPRSYILRGEKS